MNEQVSPHSPDLLGATWRKSSFSANGADCVEVAVLADESIAVRNSHFPERGVVTFTHSEMAAWIDGVKAGEFDDLAH